MLDIKFIIDNQQYVKDALAKKGFDAANVDSLISSYLALNKLKTSSQALAEEKNRLSNSIKSASAEERPAIIAKSREIGDELKKEQDELAKLQAEFDEMMLRMPNYPSPDCPVGPDESANVVLRKVGEIPHFDFKPRDHIELMELNDWSEMERIAKVSGFLFERNVNIEDISQTILGDQFAMIMMVDTSESGEDFAALSSALEEMGKKIGMTVRLQHADIFDAMHNV